MNIAPTIVELLHQWDQARETLNGPSGVRGDGDSVNLGPATWTDSYKHLEEILRELRQGAHRRQHRHLVARHRDAPIVLMSVSQRKGRLTLPAHCDLVAGAATTAGKLAQVRVRDARRSVCELSGTRYRRTHPDPAEVARGLELVASRWAERGWPAPTLPREFTEPTTKHRERVAA